MNSYPFLDNKHKPVFTGELADIVPRMRRGRIIDLTNSPVVPASTLRTKLELLHRAGELDGGLPIVRHDILVGLIPAPDLQFALDQLPNESSALCLMARVVSIDEDDANAEPDPTDFTPYIDPVCTRLSCCLFVLLTRVRRRWRWIYARLWTWCTNALLNLVFDISAC
jgi:chloride channel 3/4/5